MAMSSGWALGRRALWRDLRAGELRLLIVAVTLAVAALTAVGFFADRLKGGLQRDARQLLGGDAVVVSDAPTPQAFVDAAKALGLRSATTLVFPSMARAPDARGGATRLIALKAVQEGYPLRGNLEVAEQPEQPGRKTRAVPGRGEAWVDPGVLEALDLRMGDPLLLGDAQLRIARIITLEPDRGTGFLNFVPRVMVNAGDLPATGLVQPASRIGWHFAVAGNDPAVANSCAWPRPRRSGRTCAGCASSPSSRAGPRCGRPWSGRRNS